MSTPAAPSLDRRSFFKLAGLAGGGLVLAWYLKPATRAFGQVAKASDTMEGAFSPSAFLRIGTDGSVVIYAARPEMGQGVRTSLPMIVAEELGVDWRKVKVVPAPLDPAFGQQGAGGSMSTPTSYLSLRRVGATARTMLVRAAAAQWGVPESECTAEDGAVHLRNSDKSLSYGELAMAASRLPVPPEADVRLKDPKEFRLLGSRIGGVDNPAIVTGQSLFGLDQKVPGMMNAVYERCPVWRGGVKQANIDAIKALPGVKDAFVISQAPGGVVPGVAIVADTTWAAISARRRLQVTWDEGPHAGDSWAGFAEQARAMAKSSEMKELFRDGDVDAAFAAPGAKVVEADYSYAFVAHATLEPQNCTVSIQGDRADVWVPTQQPDGVRRSVAGCLSIPPENVAVTVTRSGGGFGRRLQADYAAEAAVIARRAGVPIKLTWTREDDMRHDHYRPGGFFFMKGAVDGKGRLSAWSARNAAFGGPLGGGAFPARYAPNFLLQGGSIDSNVPTGAWRAPGDNSHCFVICSFLDELAHAAGRDPVEFSLELLDRPVAPSGGGRRGPSYNADRMKGVIRLAAEKSGWGRKLPRGQGMGLGFYYSHLGYVAQVAEVTVSKAGELRVDRVVAAVDVGSQIVNLSGAENQAQGSIIDGLSAAWRQELGIREGRVVEGNFDAYQMLRMPDAPRKMEIHFLKTDFPPTGMGEPCVSQTPPAVANAVFAATGIRIRQMPFSRTDLRWSA